MSRICLECQYFEFDPGSPRYSDMTSGRDAKFTCQNDHWEMRNCESTDTFRKYMDSAETCSDFKMRELPPRVVDE